MGTQFNIAGKVGPYLIEESCDHFYPVFNGNLEFKTLRACKIYILFEHMPLMRFLKAVDNNCHSVMDSFLLDFNF